MPSPKAFRPGWHAVRLKGGERERGVKAMNRAEEQGAGRIARRRGSSLVEVLVALALTLLLVVGAAELLTCALGAKRKGDVTAALTHAVADRLETLRSLPFEDPALVAGEYSATRRVEPGDRLVSETWEITDEGECMKRIRLRVRPAGRSGPETEAALFISRGLGFRP